MREKQLTICLLIIIFGCASWGREAVRLLDLFPHWALWTACVATAIALLYFFRSRLAAAFFHGSWRSLLVKTLLFAALLAIAANLTVSPIEWTHYALHAPLAVLLVMQFPRELWKTALICGFTGVLDEYVQSLSIERVFDERDILLNFYGAFLGAAVMAFQKSHFTPLPSESAIDPKKSADPYK